ncbi:hypothetical protein V1517DRAFT_145867 [Lipomyces orientalis]|uniref:Uncharacterized protein n=1 Tax=Lipomyces orientalis TaxID=1233043 RepID=A0ACC3TXI3_9ASCO
MAMTANNFAIFQSKWVDTRRQSTRLMIRRSLQDKYSPTTVPRTSLSNNECDILSDSSQSMEIGQRLGGSSSSSRKLGANICTKSTRNRESDGTLMEDDSTIYVLSEPVSLRQAKISRRSEVYEPIKRVSTLNIKREANVEQMTLSDTICLRNRPQDDRVYPVRRELEGPMRRCSELSQAESLSSSSQRQSVRCAAPCDTAVQSPAFARGTTALTKKAPTRRRYRQLEAIPFVYNAGEYLSKPANVAAQIASQVEHCSPTIVSDVISDGLTESPQFILSQSESAKIRPQNNVLVKHMGPPSSEKGEARKVRILKPMVKMYEFDGRSTYRALEPIGALCDKVTNAVTLHATSAVEMSPSPVPTLTSIAISTALSITRATGAPIAGLIEKKSPTIPVPMWCDTLQELCESFPLFRDFNCGCYIYNGLAFGYLIDGFGTPRDYIGDNVVILHWLYGSGGNSVTGNSGANQIQRSDEPAAEAIKALLSNQKRATPLVLILGSNCPVSPVNVPHRYCVMDWFLVTHVWMDLDQSTGLKLWRFRFERIDRTAKPWWHNPQSEMVLNRSMPEIEARGCSDCEKEFPQVYKQGYMCLNGECPQFWKINGQSPPDDLQYNEDFLAMRSGEYQGPMPFDLRALPHVRDALSVTGWHCHNCGKLNCRQAWEGWICNSPGCHEKLLILDRIDSYLSRHDRGRLYPTYTGTPISTDVVLDESIVSAFSHSRDFSIQGCYRVMKYEVNDLNGAIYHVIPNKTLCNLPEGPDAIFKEYKAAMSIFHRYPWKTAKFGSRTLAPYFAHYARAYCKVTETIPEYTPFHLCPKAIPMALSYVHAILRMEGIPFCDQFNEVLSTAYFGSPKIGYHSDSVPDFGETIASVSLGSRAIMKFRKRVENVLNNEKPNEPILSGRIEADDVDMLLVSDITTDDGNIPLAMNPSGVSGSRSKAILQLELDHGDVVIMHGAGIQSRLLHTVKSAGEFRIEATARYVKEA